MFLIQKLLQVSKTICVLIKKNVFWIVIILINALFWSLIAASIGFNMWWVITGVFTWIFIYLGVINIFLQKLQTTKLYVHKKLLRWSFAFVSIFFVSSIVWPVILTGSLDITNYISSFPLALGLFSSFILTKIAVINLSLTSFVSSFLMAFVYGFLLTVVNLVVTAVIYSIYFGFKLLSKKFI